MCPPMWAHWRHLANMTELPLAHPSPQPKGQIDRFSCFCTAHGRKSLYFTTGVPFPQNCPFSWRIWASSNSRFLGSSRDHNPNGITIDSAVFAQMTAECPYTLIWAPLSPKIAPSHGDLNPYLAHDSMGLRGISIDSAVFAQMTAECPCTSQ